MQLPETFTRCDQLQSLWREYLLASGMLPSICHAACSNMILCDAPVNPCWSQPGGAARSGASAGLAHRAERPQPPRVALH